LKNPAAGLDAEDARILSDPKAEQRRIMDAICEDHKIKEANDRKFLHAISEELHYKLKNSMI